MKLRVIWWAFFGSAYAISALGALGGIAILCGIMPITDATASVSKLMGFTWLSIGLTMGLVAWRMDELGKARHEIRQGKVRQSQIISAWQEQVSEFERSQEQWKAETQSALFQAIADQQNRGLLDFKDAESRRHLRAVRPVDEQGAGEVG